MLALAAQKAARARHGADGLLVTSHRCAAEGIADAVAEIGDRSLAVVDGTGGASASSSAGIVRISGQLQPLVRHT